MPKEIQVIRISDGEGHLVVDVRYDFGVDDRVVIPLGSSVEDVRRIMARSYREAYDRVNKKKQLLELFKQGTITIADEDFESLADVGVESVQEEVEKSKHVIEAISSKVSGVQEKIQEAVKTLSEKGREIGEGLREIGLGVRREEGREGVLQPVEEIDEDSEEGIPWKTSISELSAKMQELKFPWAVKKQEKEEPGEGQKGGG